MLLGSCLRLVHRPRASRVTPGATVTVAAPVGASVTGRSIQLPGLPRLTMSPSAMVPPRAVRSAPISTVVACSPSAPPGATASGASTAMPSLANTVKPPSSSPLSQPASRRIWPPLWSAGSASSRPIPCAMPCTAPMSTCPATAVGISRIVLVAGSNNGTSLPITSCPCRGAAIWDC
ncbi:hypothetical protein D3C87_1092430 [compost metagenome]